MPQTNNLSTTLRGLSPEPLKCQLASSTGYPGAEQQASWAVVKQAHLTFQGKEWAQPQFR